MKDNMIITIGREFCSGGAEIGKKVADHLGIPYYDKEIIDKAAEIMKFDKETVAQYDEKPTSMFEVSGYQYGGFLYVYDPTMMMPVSMRIANAQFDAELDLAKKGGGVFVGRCADYNLRDCDNVLSVFIRADMEKRVERAVRLYDISEKQARKLIKETDKIRANYYNGHTQQKWGSAKTYDLVINSGAVGGTDAAAAIIECAAKQL